MQLEFSYSGRQSRVPVEARLARIGIARPEHAFARETSALAFLLLIGLLSLGSSASGQSSEIRGTVRTDGQHVLDKALVTLDPDTKPRVVRSNSDGQFRFPKVSTGAHELRVSAIGYSPWAQLVEVAGSELVIDITLLSAVRYLDTVVVTAERSGIFGYVGDRTDMKVLAGAVVQVIGAHVTDTTDGDGRFNLPKVASGKNYVVRVRRDGYLTRTVAISVPPKRGYEFGIFLEPGEERSRSEDALYREMDSRVHLGGYNAVLVPRAELGSDQRNTVLEPLLRARSVITRDLHLNESALMDPGNGLYPCIFVNGRQMPIGTSLDEFAVGDVETIEVYGYKSVQDQQLKHMRLDSRPVSGEPPCGQVPSDRLPPSKRSHVNPRQQISTVVIWLKK